MLFYSHDDEGRVESINMVPDYVGYARKLQDFGHKFVMQKSNNLPDPHSIWIRNKMITKREKMPITVNKTVLKAGTLDSAVFRNIPPHARVIVEAVGSTLHDLNPINSTELEIAIPTICTYTVRFICFPYKDAAIPLEAVA